MRKQYLLLVITFLVILGSCTKDSDDPGNPNNEEPTPQINYRLTEMSVLRPNSGFNQTANYQYNGEQVSTISYERDGILYLKDKYNYLHADTVEVIQSGLYYDDWILLEKNIFIYENNYIKTHSTYKYLKDSNRYELSIKWSFLHDENGNMTEWKNSIFDNGNEFLYSKNSYQYQNNKPIKDKYYYFYNGTNDWVHSSTTIYRYDKGKIQTTTVYNALNNSGENWLSQFKFNYNEYNQVYSIGLYQIDTTSLPEYEYTFSFNDQGNITKNMFYKLPVDTNYVCTYSYESLKGNLSRFNVYDDINYGHPDPYYIPKHGLSGDELLINRMTR